MSRRVPQKTREEILDAAWSLVSKAGVEISLAEIAKAANVSRQAVYLHFGSRGGLLMALVHRADERFEIRRKFAHIAEEHPPHTRLSATIFLWLDFVVEISPVAKDLIRLRPTDDAAAAAWNDRMDELKTWLLALMLSLKQENILQQGWTPEKAAEFFWALTSVQMWTLLAEECHWPLTDIKQTLAETLSRTLLQPA